MLLSRLKVDIYVRCISWWAGLSDGVQCESTHLTEGATRQENGNRIPQISAIRRRGWYFYCRYGGGKSGSKGGGEITLV